MAAISPDIHITSGNILALDIRNYQSHYWSDWLAQFKLLTRLGSFSKLSDREKVALLLLRLGTDAMTIFKTFQLDVDTVTLDELLSRFNCYFAPAMSRHVFLSQSQASQETFDQFAQRLDVLSGPCCLGPFRFSLVRDVFVKNMNDKYDHIRNQILKMPDPTFYEVLSKANEFFYNPALVSVPPPHESYSTASYDEDRSRQLKSYSGRHEVKNNHQQSKKFHKKSDSLPSNNQFNVPPISPNDEVQVTVYAEENGQYYVAPTSWENTRKLFCSALNAELKRQNRRGIYPELGSKYCLIFKALPYRVVVTAPIKNNKILVHCIDYGWTELCSPEALRQTPLDFLVVEPLVLKVSISPYSQMKLKDNQKVVMRFLEVKNNVWTVSLLDDKRSLSGLNGKNVDSNDHLPPKNFNRNKNDRTRSKPRDTQENESHLKTLGVKTYNRNQNPKNGDSNWYNSDDSSTSYDQKYTRPRFKIEYKKEDREYSKTTCCNGEVSSQRTSNLTEGETSAIVNSIVSTSTEIVNKEMKNLSVQEKAETETKPVPPIPYNEFTAVKVVYASTPQHLQVCRLNVLDDLAEMTQVLNEAYTEIEEYGRKTKPIVGNKCGATFEGDWYRAEIISVDESKGKAQVLFYDFGNKEEVDVDTLMVLPEDVRNVSSLSFSITVPSSTSFKEEDTIEIQPIKNIDAAGIWLCRVKMENGAESSDSSRSQRTVRDAKAVTKIEVNRSFESIGQSSEYPFDRRSWEDSTTPTSPLLKNSFQSIRILYRGDEGTFGMPTNKLDEVSEIISSIEKASTSCENVVLNQIVVAPYEETNFRAQVRSINRTNSIVQVFFIDFGNELSVPIEELLEMPEGVSTTCFTIKIKVDPSQECRFVEGDDIDLYLIEQELDGSWIVKVNDPECDDSFVKFKTSEC